MHRLAIAAVSLIAATALIGGCEKKPTRPQISLHELCRTPSTTLSQVEAWLDHPDVKEEGMSYILSLKNGLGLLAIHNAAMHPDEAITELLLKKGASARSDNNPMFWTPLHNAAQISNPRVALALLEHQADVNALAVNVNDGGTMSSPLHLACGSQNNPEMIELLLEYGADPNLPDGEGRTPLMCAAAPAEDVPPNPEILELLLDNNADPLLVSPKGFSFAHAAAISGDPEIIQIAADSGCDFEKAMLDSGATPLHMAINPGSDAKCVNAILEQGVNIETRNADGYTPLHASLDSLVFDLDVVSALIRAGADVNANWPPYNLTPLGMAVIAETSAHTAVPALLEAGADVNAEDAKGLTPLHWAALTKGPEVITTLIEAGADPDARTKNGMTPLDVAIRQKATENADALRGAKKTSGTGRP